MPESDDVQRFDALLEAMLTKPPIDLPALEGELQEGEDIPD